MHAFFRTKVRSKPNYKQRKDFRTKNAHIKCCWNWRQSALMCGNKWQLIFHKKKNNNKGFKSVVTNRYKSINNHRRRKDWESQSKWNQILNQTICNLTSSNINNSNLTYPYLPLPYLTSLGGGIHNIPSLAWPDSKVTKFLQCEKCESIKRN